jgi:GMP synthase (glutamine-hydrolysing)
MASPLRFLVVEGNTRPVREGYREFQGQTPAEAYAATIAEIEPGSVQDIALPADEGANLPDPAGLDSYDGVFLTGSALNIYDATPEITRQVELMRAIFACKTPVFGSCWGIQVGAVAAGGVVHKNPKGREIGFARRITRTAAGAGHPLLEGRPAMWDAPCTHLDEVAVPPGAMTILASNAVSEVQAAEIRVNGNVFWGVQYHPEFSLATIAYIMRRRADVLVAEGFAETDAVVHVYVDDLEALDARPDRRDLAWRHALDEEVLDPAKRTTELRNFVKYCVKPTRSARGRG